MSNRNKTVSSRSSRSHELQLFALVDYKTSSKSSTIFPSYVNIGSERRCNVSPAWQGKVSLLRSFRKKTRGIDGVQVPVLFIGTLPFDLHKR